MKPLMLMKLKAYSKYIVIYVSNVYDIGVLNSDPLISNTDSGDVTYIVVTDDTCHQSKQIYAAHVNHQHTKPVHQHAHKHKVVGMYIKQENQDFVRDRGPMVQSCRHQYRFDIIIVIIISGSSNSSSSSSSSSSSRWWWWWWYQ